MKTWLKITLGVVAGLAALAALNAVVVSNQTEDAERNTEGAELAATSSGTLQLLEQGRRPARRSSSSTATRARCTGTSSWRRCSPPSTG